MLLKLSSFISVYSVHAILVTYIHVCIIKEMIQPEQTVLIGIDEHQLIPTSTNWYQPVPTGANQSQQVPTSVGKTLKLLNVLPANRNKGEVNIHVILIYSSI